jgi:hypothetical protein
VSVDIAQAVDAVYRFAAGQDLGDRDLYETAFAADAVLDFREPAARFGVEVPLMEGRETIMAVAFPATAGLITTHTVTNPRLTPTQDGGDLYALVEAQHVDPDAPERRLLLKNHYHVAVVAEAPGARIARLTIVNAWSAGDPAVLFSADA